jgi:hypothetical protein
MTPLSTSSPDPSAPFLVVLHLQIVELLLKAADDLVDLVADRRGIDLDAVIHRRQLAQQRLGDLAVGRDDDLAGLAVDHVERDLLAQQDVAQRLGQLLAQLRPSWSCAPPRSAWLLALFAPPGELSLSRSLPPSWRP